MVKNLKCIIWDWNGTILDDVYLCYKIARDMLIERGMKPIEGLDAYKNVFRFPVKEYYSDMGYTYETESYEALSVEFVDLYAKGYPNCSLQPDVHEMLRYVREKGMSQILLSATGQANLDVQVAKFGLTNEFDEILGQVNDLAVSKAERARIWFEEKGYDPSEAVFIGDTDHDFEVASSIGCGCILTERGHQPRSKLEACGVPVIDRLGELKQYI